MTYTLTDDDRAAIEMAKAADDRYPTYDDRSLALVSALGGSPWRIAYAIGALDTFALAREAAAKAAESLETEHADGNHIGANEIDRTLRAIRALSLAQAVRT